MLQCRHSTSSGPRRALQPLRQQKGPVSQPGHWNCQHSRQTLPCQHSTCSGPRRALRRLRQLRVPVSQLGRLRWGQMRALRLTAWTSMLQLSLCMASHQPRAGQQETSGGKGSESIAILNNRGDAIVTHAAQAVLQHRVAGACTYASTHWQGHFVSCFVWRICTSWCIPVHLCFLCRCHTACIAQRVSHSVECTPQ